MLYVSFRLLSSSSSSSSLSSSSHYYYLLVVVVVVVVAVAVVVVNNNNNFPICCLSTRRHKKIGKKCYGPSIFTCTAHTIYVRHDRIPSTAKLEFVFVLINYVCQPWIELRLLYNSFLTVCRTNMLFLASFHRGIPLDIFIIIYLLLKHLITQILYQGPRGGGAK